MDFIKARSDAKIFFHLVRRHPRDHPRHDRDGIDIINPVQVSAVGMESSALARLRQRHDLLGRAGRYAGVFTTGAPDEVREEVRRRIDDLGANGGFVAAAVHNIQANVPPENIMAMWGRRCRSSAPTGKRRRPAPGRFVPAARHDKPVKVSTSPDALPAQMPTPEEAAAQAEAGDFYRTSSSICGMPSSTGEDRSRSGSGAGVGRWLRRPDDHQRRHRAGRLTIVGEVRDRRVLPAGNDGRRTGSARHSGIDPPAWLPPTRRDRRAVIGTVKGDLHDIGKNLGRP